MKRLLRLTALAILANALLAAPTAAQQTLKIGSTPSFIFLPVYAAEELGYFKAEGIKAEFVDFEGGAEVTTAMVGGSIEMGATMVERPMILAEKGFGAKNLVALENKNPLFLVCRNDVQAAKGDVKALKGLKLGMTKPGSGTDLSLRALVKHAGLVPDQDVAILSLGGVTSQVAALKAKAVECVMTAEPAGAIAVSQLKIARYFVDPRQGEGPKFLQHMTFSTLQAGDQFIKANPDLTGRIVKAIVKTLKRLREDPEAAVRVGQKVFPKMDVALIRQIIAVEKNTYYPAITKEAVRAVNEFQKITGAVKGDIPYEKVVAVQYKPLWSE